MNDKYLNTSKRIDFYKNVLEELLNQSLISNDEMSLALEFLVDMELQNSNLPLVA